MKWIVLSIISAILSVINMILGFDKMLNYINDGLSFHNAYVGADAYNFIINGTYSTGFFVLAAMFGIMGVGFLIIRHLDNK